jgi:hypothetical protein
MKKITLQIILLTTIILPFGRAGAQDAVKEAFKPSGKLWGYAFADYYYKSHADSAGRGNSQYSGMSANSNAFEFRRIYLGYDYNISEKFSTELLLAYEGASLSSDATRSIFIKSANVRWKNIFPGADLVAGLHQTPAFPMLEEKVMGYRSLEKTLMDMRKGSNSTDLGVSLQGKLDSGANFGYNLMVANGSGLKLENDKFKKFYGDVYAKFAGKKIIIDLYSDYEEVQLSPFRKSKMNVKVFLAYQAEKFTVGVEAFQQLQQHFAHFYEDTSMSKEFRGDIGASAFGIFVRGIILKDKLGFFVRADKYNPDVFFRNSHVYLDGYSSYNTEMFSLAGLDYTPTKNVHIMPNVWYNSYQSRVKNASGKMKADYDLVPRLTIHYIFK